MTLPSVSKKKKVDRMIPQERNREMAGKWLEEPTVSNVQADVHYNMLP